MMRCARVQDELSAWLDGELTAQVREEVRAHLEGCAECRAALESLRRTVESVRALPPAHAPAGFRDSIMAKVKAMPALAVGGTGEPVRAERAPLWRRYWGAAAALLIALLIGLFYPATRPARESPRAVARRADSAPQRGGEALLAKGPDLDKGYESNEDYAFTAAPATPSSAVAAAAPAAVAVMPPPAATAPATGGAVVASRPIGKGGPPVALRKEDEILLAKAPGEEKATMTNAMEVYAPEQQPNRAGQVNAAPVVPIEIVVASADPDHARQVAQRVLEERGWLARELPMAKAGGEVAMAKAAKSASPPRTIELNLALAQVEELRQELARAGLVMLPPPRDQAVQSLRAAVQRQEASRAAAQQTITQRSPELAVQERGQAPGAQQQDTARVKQYQTGSQAGPAQQGTATTPVLLKFVPAE